MDKVKQKDLKIEMLEVERKRMALALEGNCQKQKEVEEKIASLEKEYDSTLNEIIKMRANLHEMKGAVDVKAKRAAQLEAELAEREAELTTRNAKLEATRKEKIDLLASTQAEIDTAFRDGVEQATKDYDAQVDQLGPYLS